MKNLAHSASFDSDDKNVPLKPGIKHLASIFACVARAVGEQLAPAFEAVRPVLDWLAPIGDLTAKGWEKAGAALRAFGEWIGSLFGREVLSEGQKSQWEQAGHDAATRMIEAIKTVFTGLVDWAAGIGSQIAEALLGKVQSVLGTIRSFASSIGNAIGLGGGAEAPAVDGKRASGGPIYGGRSYPVGEKGPEIITAGSRGYVHANGSGGGIALHQSNTINISGVGDLREIVNKVEQAITTKTQELLRGVQADIGFS